MAERHHPGTQPRPKMDTPVGLFGGTCSCGWRSHGLQSQPKAMVAAQAHADAQNAKIRGAIPSMVVLDETQDFR